MYSISSPVLQPSNKPIALETKSVIVISSTNIIHVFHMCDLGDKGSMAFVVSSTEFFESSTSHFKTHPCPVFYGSCNPARRSHWKCYPNSQISICVIL